jgi:hypothetical protein
VPQNRKPHLVATLNQTIAVSDKTRLSQPLQAFSTLPISRDWEVRLGSRMLALKQ